MVAVGEVGTGRQAVRVAGVQGRVAKELLVKEGEGLVLSFWGLLKLQTYFAAQTSPPQPCLLYLTKATRCMKRRSRSLEPRASLAPTGWGPKLTRSTFTQTTMPQTMLPYLTFTPSGKVAMNWQSSSPFV